MTAMRKVETFKSALHSLTLNKIRTFLTMLGVIIGVFAVVALVSLVQGVENFVTDQFNDLGSNLIYIVPGRSGFRGNPAESFGNNKLDEKHLDLIEKYADEYVNAVSPLMSVAMSAKYKTRTYYASINGLDYQALDLYNANLDTGRNFTKAEQNSGAKVVILGVQVKEELFPDRSGVGEFIKLDGSSYEVIGILKKKSQDFDVQINIPYTTIKKHLGGKNFSTIVVQSKEDVSMDDATKYIKMALLRDLKEDDFSVMSQEDILSSVQSILNILEIALAAIAGISLFVGGIGIMNIMLVSVTERTREIGLRKALGATSFDIALQFMIEAIVISLIGGLVGLGLGWVATLIAGTFLRVTIPVWAIILAVGFSLAVGVGFGTYPAMQASKKDPIEALRYE